MALKVLILALAAVGAAPLAAHEEDRAAPAGDADTRYCMRLAPATGSLIERVKCWTREQWADQGVDVDRDWAANGVRTLG